MNTGSRGDARPSKRHRVVALDRPSPIRRGRTQIRRMRNEAEDAEGGKGGLLSELHAVAGLALRNAAAASKTTRRLLTTVTCGIIFLERLSRSVVGQLDRHDCEANIAPLASTAG